MGDNLARTSVATKAVALGEKLEVMTELESARVRAVALREKLEVMTELESAEVRAVPLG